LQPRFYSVRIGVSEVVREGFGSAFQLFKHAFDGIPIPVGDVLESE
jgi:hypothetical protein